MAVFVSARKDKEKEGKITKKLNQCLKSHISGMLEVILLTFHIWRTDVGGRVHSNNGLVS